MSNRNVPAWWYPTGNGLQRYWDGETWSEHTAPLAPTPPPSYAVAPRAGVQPGLAVAPRSPALAALATFFIVGLGQLINGEVGKGIAFFLAAVVSGLLVFLIIGIFLLPIVWIWAIVDAYRGAQKWNLRHGILS